MNLTKPALITVGVLLILCGYLFWRLETKSRQLESKTSALEEKEATIREFRTASGRTATEKPTAEISNADFEKHYADIVKDLRQDMDIKLRNVVGVLKAEIEAQGKGELILVRDTIRVPGAVPMVLDSAFIDDGYLKLKGGITARTFGYNYNYSDSLIFAVHSSRKWFLGNEKLVGTGRLSNPNAKITNQTSIVIRKRDKRFVISAGVGYNPFTNQVVPSVHAGYALFKF